MTNRYGRSLVALVLLLGFAFVARAAEPKPLEFHVTFDKSVSDKPFTGRVYVMLSKQALKGPPGGVRWGSPEPFFAKDVKDWKPGETLILGDDAVAFPAPLSKLKPGSYAIQAVMDFDRGHLSCSAAPGAFRLTS